MQARTRRSTGAAFRGAGAADCDFGGAAGHLKLAWRIAARVCGHAGERYASLCEAKFGFMQRYEGDTWKIAAAQGAPAYTEYLQQHYEHKQPGPETVSARI